MNNKLFSTSSFENELFDSMKKLLTKNHIENKYAMSKIAQATDLLNKAAEIFDQAEMTEYSNDIEKVLISLAEEVVK